MDTSFQALDQLLTEDIEHATARVGSRSVFCDDDQLVLYGAGNLGRYTLKKLREIGVQPAAFADDTPSKQGTVIDDLPVMTPREAAKEFVERTRFIVTIMNVMLRFVDARKRLQQFTHRSVLSFLDLTWQYSHTFLPYYQFELPQRLLSKSAEIRRGFEVWSDEESRRQYVAHLQFRLHLDYESLPDNSGQGYFPRDIFRTLPENITFVDCGAYDGDTLRRFIEHQGAKFRRIYAFEPDENNCARLRNYVAGLGQSVANKIEIYNAAVGDTKKRIGFNTTGDMSASFDEAAVTQVEVIPLDEVIDRNGTAVFLKFDVEGGEWEALQGARRLLSETKPLIAISVYHRPDDLWQLPLYLESLRFGYQLFLRTQGEDGMDVICYAIPPQLV